MTSSVQTIANETPGGHAVNRGSGQAKMIATFRKSKLIPVVVIDDPENAVAVAGALVDGGVPIAEVTLRTASALESLKRISAERPDIYVGAGTVLNRGQAIQARKAGAKFIVSPGFNQSVVDYCLEQGLGVLPGVLSASEIEIALESGLKLLKIFPIEPAGGVAYLNAIGAVFTEVEFTASGGITPDNYLKYLALKNVVAAGVLWIVARDLIAAKQFDRIREAVSGAAKAVAG